MINGSMPEEGQISVCWLGAAGFLIRSRDAAIGIDVYLSNSCMMENGAFKRLTAPGAAPRELELDYLIASHEHGDHLDEGSIHELIRPDNKTILLCPAATKEAALRYGVAEDRIVGLDRGQTLTFGDITIRAVFSDHGPYTPDAIGCFITIAGKVVYFIGDSGFRTDFLECVGPHEPIDVFLVPINGKFGNPDARDAAYFVQMLKPKLAIPCHFWLSKEHGGDPGEFAECCKKIAPGAGVAVLAVGETIYV